ncbi:translation initiation factor IF-2 subunit beta [Candidatus Micrarchaeota archaeon]|nr:translation initiation factor IF-2 subunit beta [Candidatus Micrarchaeota archaeon]
MEYEKLLDRAYATLPKKKESSERFEIPTADTMLHGTKTIIKNFDGICQKIRRTPEEVSKFLFRELAIPGKRDKDGLLLHGKIAIKLINDKIALYTQTHVICKECKKPDTHTQSQGRGPKILICEACGARSTILE